MASGAICTSLECLSLRAARRVFVAISEEAILSKALPVSSNSSPVSILIR